MLAIASQCCYGAYGSEETRRFEKIQSYHSASQSIALDLDLLHQWQATKRTNSSQVTSHPQGLAAVVHWTRLDASYVKCNIDAVLFNDGKFEIGCCIRNAAGAFVKAKTVCFNGNPQSHKAEALGLLVAIHWLQELNFQKSHH